MIAFLVLHVDFVFAQNSISGQEYWRRQQQEAHNRQMREQQQRHQRQMEEMRRNFERQQREARQRSEWQRNQAQQRDAQRWRDQQRNQYQNNKYTGSKNYKSSDITITREVLEKFLQNPETVQKLRDDPKMQETLMKLLSPELQKVLQEKLAPNAPTDTAPIESDTKP